MANLGQALVGLLSVAIVAAGPARATEAESTGNVKAPSDTIGELTVTAPNTPDRLIDETTQFVRNHVPENRAGQLSRFRDKICVNVVGLPAAYDAFIVQRVVKLASQVNAPIDHSGKCTPNVNVIFSPDPQAQLEDIAKRRQILLGFQWVAQMRRLASFEQPIQSWYLTRSVGTDGQSVLELNHGSTFMDVAENIAGAVTGRAGSRLGTDQSSELVHTLILVDANKVADAQIGSIADYIAVLALSRWQSLNTCEAIPTILNLMADNCDAVSTPETTTNADIALLAGLYALNPRDLGAQQRATIASAIRKASKAQPQH